MQKGNPSQQQRAFLRVCASCEWIFTRDNARQGSDGVECPQCSFGSYGAHYVYGNKAYRHMVTQRPWIDKKVAAIETKLWLEAKQSVKGHVPVRCTCLSNHPDYCEVHAA